MRVGAEARVMNFVDGRVIAQEARQRGGGRDLVPDPESQGLQPSVEKKTSKGVERCAQVVEFLANGLDDVMTANDGSCDHVGVTTEVFRGAMQDKVETMLQRPEAHG